MLVGLIEGVELVSVVVTPRADEVLVSLCRIF
jgi:hypothetical protein